MQGTIGPDLARVALAFHRNHPSVPLLEILDACMTRRAGNVKDFGSHIDEGAEFVQLLVKAFGADWRTSLSMFADRYALSG